MREFIRISEELREKMKKEFRCERSVIWRACQYLTNGGRAQKIREYALEHGGVAIREEYIPICSCDRDDKEMLVENFGNGVVLELNLKDSSARIRKGDYVHERFEGLTLRGWANACMIAQTIANAQALAQ